MTPRRETDLDPAKLVKLADHYGVGLVFAMVLLAFVLGLGTWFARDMHAMLNQHIQQSDIGAINDYRNCISLALMAGTPTESCIAPRTR